MTPAFIGITGGSGSGKASIARALVAHYGDGHLQIIHQDAYYKNRAGLSPEERAHINYDHPDAFDEPLLLEHMQALLAGQGIDQPLYDYATHLRKDETLRVEPAPVIVLEGILVFAMASVLPLFDLKLYVDADADVRILRRLRRDVAVRGRTVDSVIAQYLESVRPMHAQFIEPTKSVADIVLPGEGNTLVTLGVLRSWIDARIARG